jgi:3',5'-cyclic-nucleotide phosphodiesterase
MLDAVPVSIAPPRAMDVERCTLKVLGACGGIGGRCRTTAFLVGDSVLLDAGTGMLDLSLKRLARIDHVLLTHAHIDHIAGLPLLLDSTAARRDRPVTVHATAPVVEILRRHLFNGTLWPDFSRIRLASGAPVMRFAKLRPGRPVELGPAAFTPIAAAYGVPAAGYLVEGGSGSLLFSGDTAGDAAFWATANATPGLRYIVLEVSFPDREAHLAQVSGHLHPAGFAAQVSRLQRLPTGFRGFYVTHMKPGYETEIRRELRERHGLHFVEFLVRGDALEL